MFKINWKKYFLKIKLLRISLKTEDIQKGHSKSTQQQSNNLQLKSIVKIILLTQVDFKNNLIKSIVKVETIEGAKQYNQRYNSKN